MCFIWGGGGLGLEIYTPPEIYRPQNAIVAQTPKTAHLVSYTQGVSGGIVNILGGVSMDCCE